MSIEITASADSRGARRKARGAVWTRFRKSVPGMTGLVLLVIFAAMAVAYPILIRTVWDPNIYDPETGLDITAVEKLYVEEVIDPATEVGRLPHATG